MKHLSSKMKTVRDRVHVPGSLGRRMSLFALCFVVILTSTATLFGAAAATKVQIFLPISPTAWSFYLAEKRGYFKAEGLDVTIRVFESGGVASQAFIAQGADMLEAGEMPTMSFLQKAGGAAVGIAQVARAPADIQLIGPANFKGPEDLVGKTVATNFGSTTEYYLRKYIKDNSLDDKVNVINLDPGSQVPALIRGNAYAIESFLEVAVRALSNKNYRLISAGGSSLLLSVSKKFLDTNPSGVEAVLRALRRAAEDIKTDQSSALAAVSGEHGLLDEAYRNDMANGGIDFVPQYTSATQGFLEDVSKFLVEQGKFEKPFEFCRLLNLVPLRNVDPKMVTASYTCK